MFGTRRTISPSITTTYCDERRSWTRPRDDRSRRSDDEGAQGVQHLRRDRPRPVRALLRRHDGRRRLDPEAARSRPAVAMTRSDLVRDGAVLTGGAARSAKLNTVPGLDVRPALARLRTSLFQIL